MSTVERHHAILRDQLHKLDSQLRSEGREIKFSVLLAESLFAKNCLLGVGGATPYQGLFGRTPSLLPDPLQAVTASEELDEDSQNVQRVRELAIQTMVESTAQARLRRANKSHSRLPGESLELKTGDLIEFYRPASSKDLSGWRGPATVTDTYYLNLRWSHPRKISRQNFLDSNRRYSPGTSLLVIPFC